VSIAAELHDDVLLADNRRLLGTIALSVGDLARAKVECEARVELARGVGHAVALSDALVALGFGVLAVDFGQPHVAVSLEAAAVRLRRASSMGLD